MTKKEEIFHRIDVLLTKQDQPKRLIQESASDLSQLVTYGAIDTAMKIRAKQFERLSELDKELKPIVHNVRELIEQTQ